VVKGSDSRGSAADCQAEWLVPRGQYERKPRVPTNEGERLRLINDCFESQETINHALEARIVDLERRLEAANERLAVGYLPAKI
jgi:hypothetical protein